MPRPLKDSGIPWVGQIPADWDMHPLYYYFGERNRPNRLGKNNNLLSLSYGKIIKKDINTNEGLLPASYNSYNIIEPLDIVLRLTDLQNDKRSLRTGLSFERGIITSAYVTLKPVKQVSSVFFHYLLHAYDVSKVLYNMGNGVRQSLNYDELSKLPLIEPPLAEQKKIADFLDKKCGEVDTLAHNIQQQIDTLEQYKRAIITETVTKGLNPSAPMKDSGIPWIGQIPKHWKSLPLRYWISERHSGAWGYEEIGAAGDCFCVRVADFDYNVFGLRKGTPTTVRNYPRVLIKRLMLRTQDILIEKSGGGDKNPVGRTIIIRKELKTPTLFANFIERVRVKPQLCALYLQYFFVAFYKQGLSPLYFQQTIGIQNLNISKMFKLEKAPCPPFKEQQAIASYLDDKCGKIDSLIKTKQEQLAKLEEYKKAIIFEYVTGKKPVPEEER